MAGETECEIGCPSRQVSLVFAFIHSINQVYVLGSIKALGAAGMRTSHVGSYPLDYSLNNFKKAFLDTVEAGITVPPVPQLRPFTDMYLDPLEEMGYLKKIKGGKYNPIRLEGEPEPPEMEEVNWFINVARERNFDLSHARMPITGPFTLASRIETGEGGIFNSLITDKKKIFEFLVPYISRIAKRMDELGFGVIFVDEPVVGLLVGRRILLNYSESDILEAYELIFSGVKAEKGTHICGKISPRLSEILMKVPVTYLSHEFYDSRSNLDRFSKESLEEGGKVLSPGIVSAQSMNVETVEEVRKLLIEIIDRFGLERVDLVSGDCGFGGLKAAGPHAYNIAISKLRLISEVVRSLS